jgi:hypothetical protein
MRISSVKANNHKHAFEVTIERGVLAFPYAKAVPAPSAENPVADVHVDEECEGRGFVYTLADGHEGFVHVEQVLEYNRDPDYMRDMLVVRLTLEARERLGESPLSRREIIRRLGTSPAQFYRLLDPSNYNKSIDAMLSLFHALDCDVDVLIRPN